MSSDTTKAFGIRDLPITAEDHELLGVMPYVNSLSTFIKKCDTPMTISIQGDWGSGKTSAMYLIKENLEKNNKNGAPKIQTVWFNTWQFSQFNQSSQLPISLISYFVEGIDVNDGVASKVTSVLKGLGKMTLAIAADQAIAGVLADKIMDADGNGTVDFAKSVKILRDELQSVVAKKIEKDKIDRFVIFLDDLDRLNPERAVELLEVLKNFLDIRHCVFVLAVDYSVVVQGIKRKFNTDILDEKGRSFFDKIIQMPFTLPVSLYDNVNYIKSLLKEIGLIDDKSTISDSDINTYVNLVTGSVGFNPRGLKRVFNLFQLVNIVAENQLVLNDDDNEKRRALFALLCLQTSFEKLYVYLSSNLYELTHDLFDALRDPERLETDDEFTNLREVLGFTDSKMYVRLSNFMSAFFTAVQFQFDNNDEYLSDQEVDLIKNLISFSSVTSTNLSVIDDVLPDESRKRSRVKLEGWEAFEQDFVAKVGGDNKEPLDLARELHIMANNTFLSDQIVFNFTGNGIFSIHVAKSTSRQKVFCYIDIRKTFNIKKLQGNLEVNLYYNGSYFNTKDNNEDTRRRKTIKNVKDINTWFKEDLISSFNNFCDNNNVDDSVIVI